MTDEARSTGSDSSRDRGSVGPLIELLRRAGSTVELVIAGSSMAPSIPDGATVRVRCGTPDVLRPGTPLAFLAGGTAPTVHRIVSHADGAPFLVTRGDANLFCDPPLPVEDVIGIVDSVGVDGSWHDVPPRAHGGVVGNALSRLNRFLMIRALGLHVRAGQAVALLFLTLVAPKALFGFLRRPSRPELFSMFRLTRPGGATEGAKG